MDCMNLPVDTWIVVAHPARNGVALVSQHHTKDEAEAECDRRNRTVNGQRYSAYLLVEPIAERMGGHRAPTRTT
jgi:hypothetical protein